MNRRIENESTASIRHELIDEALDLYEAGDKAGCQMIADSLSNREYIVLENGLDRIDELNRRMYEGKASSDSDFITSSELVELLKKSVDDAEHGRYVNATEVAGIVKARLEQELLENGK